MIQGLQLSATPEVRELYAKAAAANSWASNPWLAAKPQDNGKHFADLVQCDEASIMAMGFPC
jgi:hypothetical protein